MKRLRTAPVAIAAALAFPLAFGGCDRQPATSTQQTGGTGRTTGAPAASAPADPGVTDVAADATSPAGTSGPKMTFKSTEYDFGRISEVEVKSGTLEFTNDGDETLVIERVKTSCGCTAATPSKREYAPGESGTIDIEFDPAGPGSRQKKYINVFTNAAESMVRLMILADVDAFVSIEPRFLKLGVMELGKPHQAEVTVSSQDDDFEIESIVLTNPDLSYRVSDATDGSKAKVVTLTLSERAPWGAVFSWLEVTVKARPAPGQTAISHMARVRIQGQLFGALRAEPDKFRFGIKPEEAFERVIRLYREDDQPFFVSNATITAPGLIDPTVSVEQVSATECRLIVTGTGPKILRRYSGAVTITTDIPGEETIEIGVEGVVRLEAAGVK